MTATVKRWVAGDYFDQETHFLCEPDHKNALDMPREAEFTSEEIERIEKAFAEWNAVQEMLHARYNGEK